MQVCVQTFDTLKEAEEAREEFTRTLPNVLATRGVRVTGMSGHAYTLDVEERTVEARQRAYWLVLTARMSG